MTNKQWIKEKRKKKRFESEERKELEKLKLQSPFYLFEDRVNKIGCRCKAEEMRGGIFCDTCKLKIRVNDYMIDLFHSASQGRTTL